MDSEPLTDIDKRRKSIQQKDAATGQAHRGLSPHKFTPVPGVHKELDQTP